MAWSGTGFGTYIVLKCVLISVEAGGLSFWWLRLIQKYGGEPQFRQDSRLYLTLITGCAAAGAGIGFGWAGRGAAAQLAGGVLSAYLLCTAVTDARTCQVYTFLHLPGAAAGIFLLLREGTLYSAVLPLAIYALLQHFLFTHMYGKADGKVFWVCALYQAAFGAGLLQFLLHMAASLFCLAAVQAVRKNIDRRGNLKKEVAFVPYIAAAEWFLVCIVQLGAPHV